MISKNRETQEEREGQMPIYLFIHSFILFNYFIFIYSFTFPSLHPRNSLRDAYNAYNNSVKDSNVP